MMIGAFGISWRAPFSRTALMFVDVVAKRSPGLPLCGCADLEDAAILQVEELIGVAMLLVVVDQPGVRG